MNSPAKTSSPRLSANVRFGNLAEVRAKRKIKAGEELLIGCVRGARRGGGSHTQRPRRRKRLRRVSSWPQTPHIALPLRSYGDSYGWH